MKYTSGIRGPESLPWEAYKAHLRRFRKNVKKGGDYKSVVKVRAETSKRYRKRCELNE